HGLYWLPATLASRRPPLVAIDDLHWCDVPSLRWLASLLPRLEDLEVSIVVSLRPSEPGVDPSLVGQILADPLTTIVRPAPLSAAAVTQLVRELVSPTADEAFCLACYETTGGSPLLVHELMRALAAEAIEPTSDSVQELPALAARAGSRAVTVRLA